MFIKYNTWSDGDWKESNGLDRSDGLFRDNRVDRLDTGQG